MVVGHWTVELLGELHSEGKLWKAEARVWRPGEAGHLVAGVSEWQLLDLIRSNAGPTNTSDENKQLWLHILMESIRMKLQA